MGWSVTVNNLQQDFKLVWDQDIIEKFISENPEYGFDLAVTVQAAQSLRLESATLMGGRTPNPYGDDEVVIVSVTGMQHARDFNAAMKAIIASGPDAEALAEQARASDVP